MGARTVNKRLEERKEKGWARLTSVLDECRENFELGEWFSWMEAEEEWQRLVERVVSGRQHHFRAPTVATVAAVLGTAPRSVHVIDLALALRVRKVLAPPSVLLGILERNLAPKGPFKRTRNHCYWVTKEKRNAAPSLAAHA